MVEILAKQGDITEEEVDAIVNPANSLGVMGGGVAWVIKRKGGEDIEEEAVKKAPISIGCAISTQGGNLPTKFVIHASTMEQPAMKISLENVKKATLAALECASNLKISTMAFPGMGTGVGGIKKKDAAQAMAMAIKNFSKKTKPL